MTRYLLDTSVLSLLEPARPIVPDGFLSWVRRHEHELFASSMSVAEVEQGIASLERRAKNEDLRAL